VIGDTIIGRFLVRNVDSDPKSSRPHQAPSVWKEKMESQSQPGLRERSSYRKKKASFESQSVYWTREKRRPSLVCVFRKKEYVSSYTSNANQTPSGSEGRTEARSSVSFSVASSVLSSLLATLTCKRQTKASLCKISGVENHFALNPDLLADHAQRQSRVQTSSKVAVCFEGLPNRHIFKEK